MYTVLTEFTICITAKTRNLNFHNGLLTQIMYTLCLHFKYKVMVEHLKIFKTCYSV